MKGCVKKNYAKPIWLMTSDILLSLYFWRCTNKIQDFMSKPTLYKKIHKKIGAQIFIKSKLMRKI